MLLGDGDCCSLAHWPGSWLGGLCWRYALAILAISCAGDVLWRAGDLVFKGAGDALANSGDGAGDALAMRWRCAGDALAVLAMALRPSVHYDPGKAS